MNKFFEFQIPAHVVFGHGSLEKTGDLVRELGGRRVLLVTDPGIVNAGILDRVLKTLHDQKISCFVFSDVHENPTTDHVERGTAFARQTGEIDLIVGLGGGSPMDCAKGINFLLTNGGRMEDYWGANKAKKPMLPSIGIPTTAGTGSEAQSYALISQTDTHRKMACGDHKARFRGIILDPSLTVTLPKNVTAVSGIDAITHSVESYVSTSSNPVSKMFSLEAWRLLQSNFELALNQPDNLEARGAMLLGSYFAGTAIEFSMLGAAHACANPLSARFDILHGVAVSLMLPHVIRFNSPAVNGHYAELLDAAGIEKSRNNAESLSLRITSLKNAASLPATLRDCGVDRNSLPLLAKEAAEQWTGKFNPRPVTESEFLNLYESAF